MNKEEKFVNLVNFFLDFRKFVQEYSGDIEISNKQAEIFLLKEEDVLDKFRSYLLENCLDIKYHAIMLHPLISNMSDEDQYHFNYYIVKSLSLYKNENGNYKLIKFIPISYWNDQREQYPLLFNSGKNNDNTIIKEAFNRILNFIENKTEEEVEVNLFKPIMKDNLLNYVFEDEVGSIVNFLNKLDSDVNRDNESLNWYQNIVVPIVIESKSYKSLYILNNKLKINDILYENPISQREMYSEISFFNEIPEKNETLKFYFWLSTVLSAEVVDEGNDDEIVSRDGFIHCVVTDDGLLSEFNVNIDLILGNDDIKVLKANKKIFRDGEIAEISTFWAERSSKYDSFTFTFGVKESERENDKEQYNAIFFMPKEIVRH